MLTFQDDDRFYLLCGKTIRSWAYFEAALFFFFQALSGSEHFRCRIIWMRLPTFKTRKDMLLTLAATYCSEQDERKLNKFLERATRLASKRNMIAHCSGGVDTETGKPFFMGDRADKEIGVDFLGMRKFEWANLENWPDEISSLGKEMMGWANEFSVRIEVKPKMHRQ